MTPPIRTRPDGTKYPITGKGGGEARTVVAAGAAATLIAAGPSLGGIGGCPFAPAATGNIPTEDLLYMLERSGIETGVSLPALIETARWLQEQPGRPVPGMLAKAGTFPRSAAR